MVNQDRSPVLAWTGETPALLHSLAAKLTPATIERVAMMDYGYKAEDVKQVLRGIIDEGDCTPLLNIQEQLRECLLLGRVHRTELVKGPHTADQLDAHIMRAFSGMLLSMYPDWNAGDDSSLLVWATSLWSLDLKQDDEALSFLTSLKERDNRGDYPPSQATIALLDLWLFVENTALKDEEATLAKVFDCDTSLRAEDLFDGAIAAPSWSAFRVLAGPDFGDVQFIGERFSYWSERARTAELAGVLDVIGSELQQR